MWKRRIRGRSNPTALMAAYLSRSWDHQDDLREEQRSDDCFWEEGFHSALFTACVVLLLLLLLSSVRNS